MGIDWLDFERISWLPRLFFDKRAYRLGDLSPIFFISYFLFHFGEMGEREAEERGDWAPNGEEGGEHLIFPKDEHPVENHFEGDAAKDAGGGNQKCGLFS